MTVENGALTGLRPVAPAESSQHTRPARACEGHIAAVTEMLDGLSSRYRLPLRLVGTAFQQRVWEALQHIPYGNTLSYSALAEYIGAPRAARAVGSACGANPIAGVVPCHRVLASDGTLGGYAYGVPAKRRLLTYESRVEMRARQIA